MRKSKMKYCNKTENKCTKETREKNETYRIIIHRHTSTQRIQHFTLNVSSLSLLIGLCILLLSVCNCVYKLVVFSFQFASVFSCLNTCICVWVAAMLVLSVFVCFSFTHNQQPNVKTEQRLCMYAYNEYVEGELYSDQVVATSFSDDFSIFFLVLPTMTVHTVKLSRKAFFPIVCHWFQMMMRKFK